MRASASARSRPTPSSTCASTSLTGLERDKIEAEYLELIKHISYLRDLLANPHKIYGVIKEELLEIKQKYGDRAARTSPATRARSTSRT
jgi:DNA gyrase/topoisomerase IV subunit A